MNWHEIETRWDQYRGRIQAHWKDLTSDDVETIDGNYETLLRKLQERYGFAAEHAARDVDEFVAGLDYPRQTPIKKGEHQPLPMR